MSTSDARRTVPLDEDMQSAVNAHGMDAHAIIQSTAKDGAAACEADDPYPDDSRATQINCGRAMRVRFKTSQRILVTDGSAARSTPMTPAAFMTVKKAMAGRSEPEAERDAIETVHLEVYR